MGARVLVVEDDPDQLVIVKTILEGAGHSVETATSVRGGLAILQTMAFDALITDLNLPDGTGLDLANQARAGPLRLYVILMTADAEGASPAGLASRQNGEVDDYLVKPVSGPQLLNALRRAL